MAEAPLLPARPAQPTHCRLCLAPFSMTRTIEADGYCLDCASYAGIPVGESSEMGERR